MLDASVAAKWYLPGEELETQARALLTAAELGAVSFYVPDVFWAEVISALHTATRGRSARIDAAAVDRALADLEAVRIEVVASKPLLPAALRLARDHGSAVYDSLYVALAEQLGLPFVTADSRLHTRLAHLTHVRWLGGYAAGLP